AAVVTTAARGATAVATASSTTAVTTTLAATTLGIACAALPQDLAERTMLGDTGANAVGALVGAALAAHPSRRVRIPALAAVLALTLLSEKVSFSRVIATTPGLRELDAWGRR
ncbi:hypothetical protein PU560_11195, partial [Georgenia sp. 10Sc9-8]|nr:hypothetical protein [Georgenia halotolerans]